MSGQPAANDHQVELLRRRLVEVSPRLNDQHLLVLSDTLHEIIRRRRGERSFAPVERVRVDLRC